MVEIVILGGDGYIGWPLALELASTYPGKRVLIIDSFLTRKNSIKFGAKSLLPVASMPVRLAATAEALGVLNLDFRQLCCSNTSDMMALFAELSPEVVYHLAHQPAAPYSMLGVQESIETVLNNEVAFLNLIWSLKESCPDCHLIKLGSLGAYAKRGLDIPEGDAFMSINGQVSLAPVPFPRASDDFYHVTKINDSNFAGLACRKWGLRITDVMQSTVFGVGTDNTVADQRLHTRFHYDEIFGTVVNRFLTQAIAGLPLTVYGDGSQTTGVMTLDGCLKVLANLAYDPGEPGVHRIVNSTQANYSINELAEVVRDRAQQFGIGVRISRNRYNPRFEGEQIYECRVQTPYVKHLLGTASLHSCFARSFQILLNYKSDIDGRSIEPTHSWLGKHKGGRPE